MSFELGRQKLLSAYTGNVTVVLEIEMIETTLREFEAMVGEKINQDDSMYQKLSIREAGACQYTRS